MKIKDTYSTDEGRMIIFEADSKKEFNMFCCHEAFLSREAADIVSDLLGFRVRPSHLQGFFVNYTSREITLLLSEAGTQIYDEMHCANPPAEYTFQMSVDDFNSMSDTAIKDSFTEWLNALRMQDEDAKAKSYKEETREMFDEIADDVCTKILSLLLGRGEKPESVEVTVRGKPTETGSKDEYTYCFVMESPTKE